MQNVNFALYLHCNCENSSVGRAQPCQGWGRGFESRFSLNGCPDGGMVDTQDLKSCGHHGCAGSSPASGTSKEANYLNIKWLAFLLVVFVNGLSTSTQKHKKGLLKGLLASGCFLQIKLTWYGSSLKHR